MTVGGCRLTNAIFPKVTRAHTQTILHTRTHMYISHVSIARHAHLHKRTRTPHHTTQRRHHFGTRRTYTHTYTHTHAHTQARAHTHTRVPTTRSIAIWGLAIRISPNVAAMCDPGSDEETLALLLDKDPRRESADSRRRKSADSRQDGQASQPTIMKKRRNFEQLKPACTHIDLTTPPFCKNCCSSLVVGIQSVSLRCPVCSFRNQFT